MSAAGWISESLHPAIALCVLIAPAIASAGDEPRQYDGRTIAEWRERIGRLDFTDPSINRDVPGLIALVRDADVPEITRRQAAVTLARIGEPAQEAIPLLIALAGDSSCESGQSSRFWALKALSRFGRLAKDAAPLAVEIVEDPKSSQLTRLMSIEVLCQIGPQSPHVLPALLRIVQTTEAAPDSPAAAQELERRIAAVAGLELLGEHAAPAVPALIRTTSEPSILMRRAAVFTLGTIGPSAEPAIPALVDRLVFDDSAEVQDLSAAALAGIGASAEPPLRQLLADPDQEVRRRVAQAVGTLPALQPSTIDALRHVADHDESPLTRVIALEGLWRHGNDRKDVIAKLVAHLADEDREARAQAARALEGMGTAVRTASEQLEAMARDDRPHVRQAAQRVLRALENQPAP